MRKQLRMMQYNVTNQQADKSQIYYWSVNNLQIPLPN
jgi:hypothetical protein